MRGSILSKLFSMKKFSNTFFVVAALLALVVSLGTGCGGSSSSSNSSDRVRTPEEPDAGHGVEPEIPDDPGFGDDP